MKATTSIAFSAAFLLTTVSLALAQPPPGPGYHAVTLPKTIGKGAATQSEVLVETAHVSVKTVALRQGASLPSHSSPQQVTIQALAGEGVVQIGTQQEKISPTRMIVLAPGMAHEVKPEGKGDLLLLVHEVKRWPRGMRRGRGPGPY